MYARHCFFWLRQLRRVRRSLDIESVKTSVHAFVTSRVDYCNSVLTSAPKKVTDKLQHVQNAAASLVWLGAGNMSVVCLGWGTMTYTGWLFLSECSTSLLWQSIVVLGTELQGISPTTVCQSLKLLVASTCDMPDVINCQFREFATAPLGPCIFCRRTKSLESTVWSAAGSSCWPRAI